MEFRKLNFWEHGRTRRLYEAVFPEDDKDFVDYYYRWKTKDNSIYAAEDSGGVRAMVHLNPFLVSVRGIVKRMHYVVAVATQEEYRHQGLMRRLLEMAERDVQAAGEDFIFLMPASEKIYLPFGYRFFCEQRRGILRGTESSGAEAGEYACGVYCRPLKQGEYSLLADFANRTLETSYEMFIYRDKAYYERLQEEQRCQGGEVMVICRRECGDAAAGEIADIAETGRIGLKACEHPEAREKMIGTFCTAVEHRPDGDMTELREIIFDPAYKDEVQGALSEFAGRQGKCRVLGCMPGFALEREQTIPLLMGKVPGDGAFCGGCIPEHIYINEVV